MKIRSLVGWVIIATVGVIPVAGCGDSTGNPGTKKKVVLATTGMIGDLVRRVAGDTVELQELMGAGVDPHAFQPKGGDTTKLSKADLVLYNGLHLEGKIVNILEQHPRGRAVCREIPKERLLSEEGQPDPHVWFDVSLWIFALQAVEKDLTELIPANAELYHANAAAYRKELEQLHEEVKREIGSIPKEQRVFVTAHDAFNYFGQAYQIDVLGLQGISTNNEAGEKRIHDIVEKIVTRKIKAVFHETSVSDEGVRAVVERCKSRGYEVRIAEGSLYSDAMGEAGTPEGTYPGMVRHNVRTVVKALK